MTDDKKKPRPDVNETAARVMREATGQSANPTLSLFLRLRYIFRATSGLTTTGYHLSGWSGRAVIRLVRDEDDYAKRLLSEVPPQFFILWLKYLRAAYRAAVTGCLDFKEPEGRDLLGYYRRARAEEAFADAALDAGLSCESKLNSRRTSRHRVLVTGRFVFVQCHGSHPGEVVRNAEHRVDYAQLANGDLWTGFSHALSIPPEDAIFAILQHGEHPKSPSQLGFAVVNFPNADVDRYVSRVNLMGRFGEDRLASETRTAEDLHLRPKQKPEVEDAD